MTLRELVNCIALRDTMVCPTLDGCLIGVPYSWSVMPDGDYFVELIRPDGSEGCVTFTPGFAQDDPQDVRLTPR
jgi:hypothetical protein